MHKPEVREPGVHALSEAGGCAVPQVEVCSDHKLRPWSDFLYIPSTWEGAVVHTLGDTDTGRPSESRL